MTGPAAGRAPAQRGVQTRQRILDAALQLFREQSYERTTMRAVAAAAGVSVGNAYYYFSGKEELVQAFYEGIQAEHRQRAAAVLERTTGFTDRLRGVLHAGVDVMSPHHDFAGTFIRVAVDPTSPASPFSPQSTPARRAAIELFGQVVGGSRISITDDLRAQLPELLWLAYLGVTLFWVHDRSPEQARTRLLVDTAAPMVGRLLRLSRLPVMRSVVADVLTLVRTAQP